MILNEEEMEFKSRIWTSMNKHWLQEQNKKKREKKEQRKNKSIRSNVSLTSQQVQSEALSPTSQLQSLQSPAKIKQVKARTCTGAESHRDALKLRYPEINPDEID